MFALERQKRILELLNSTGAVWVNKLSEELGVTEETVRRDLEKLEKQEALMRTHGGAVPIDENIYELSLEKRKHTNIDIKEKLAQIAVEFISPGDTVFLDASTTTFCLAKEIKRLKNVTVVTNSIRVINELAGREELKVIAVGGMVSSNQSFVGSLAESSIESNYFANKMFFSSKGITEDVGILESNEQECAIKRKMMGNSKEKYYLCDKTKVGRVGFVKLAALDEIHTFITEAELSSSFQQKLMEQNVQVVKADI